jgi:hypothetical protein
LFLFSLVSKGRGKKQEKREKKSTLNTRIEAIAARIRGCFSLVSFLFSLKQKKGRGGDHARTTTRRMEEPCCIPPIGAGYEIPSTTP